MTVQIEIDLDDPRITQLIHDLQQSGLYPNAFARELTAAVPQYYKWLVEAALENGLLGLKIQLFHEALKRVKGQPTRAGVDNRDTLC